MFAVTLPISIERFRLPIRKLSTTTVSYLSVRLNDGSQAPLDLTLRVFDCLASAKIQGREPFKSYDQISLERYLEKNDSHFCTRQFPRALRGSFLIQTIIDNAVQFTGRSTNLGEYEWKIRNPILSHQARSCLLFEFLLSELNNKCDNLNKISN